MSGIEEITKGTKVEIIGHSRLRNRTGVVVGLEYHKRTPGGVAKPFYRVNTLDGLNAATSYLLKPKQVRVIG